MTEITRLPHVMMWIWIHLLQFEVSNQITGQAEDALNKSDRPLPSGRVSLGTAIFLRWILIPICWAISIAYSFEALYTSIALVFLTVVYNELSGHAGNFVIRNLLNVGGYACYEIGAILVAGEYTLCLIVLQAHS